MKDILYIVIPCYNEQEVLPKTSKSFLEQLNKMITEKQISNQSKIMFVDDGSEDDTWEIIQNLAKQDKHFVGIRQSRNRGHQNTLLAGLMEVKDVCDLAISIDCDGQDDISAMSKMVEKYHDGAEIVYGVRNDRKEDSFLKRNTAQFFYKLLRAMGVEAIYNHADYRLLSDRALKELSNFKEVNLFLRGLVPLIGFSSAKVYYSRSRRVAGKSHYSLGKMLGLAFDGITSLSIKPIRMILCFGFFAALASFIGIIYSFIIFITGHSVNGWASLATIVCFFGGVQTMSLGIIGEYIGKAYLETKTRPRYIISERTYKKRYRNDTID